VTKPSGKLYEPQLIPERKVLADKEAMLGEQRGTDLVRRVGEQYLMTCHCGAVVVTSDEREVSRFRADHAHPCGA
jgi:hypothetical protein